MRIVAASVLVGLPVLPIYAEEPSPKGVNFYSLEREIQIGQETAAFLTRMLPVVQEPKLDAWLASLTAELAKHADPRFTYRVTVYDDRKPLGLSRLAMAMPIDALQGRVTEPAALPGGPIFVPLSLLAEAPDETAFAFQLAHAMAHVSLRHSTKQATRMELQNLAAVALPVPTSGVAARAVLSGEDLAMRLSLFTFARRFELEADELATGILAEAGYNPQKVIAYLEGQPAVVGHRSSAFSAHPTIERRIETILVQLEKMPERQYGASNGAFEEIRELAASIQ